MGYTKYRAACRAFFQNIEDRAYLAATSALVLNEVIHKLILAETTKTYRLRRESDAKKLIEDQPETISSLTNVWKDYAVIRAYPLVIHRLPTTPARGMWMRMELGLPVQSAPRPLAGARARARWHAGGRARAWGGVAVIGMKSGGLGGLGRGLAA